MGIGVCALRSVVIIVVIGEIVVIGVLVSWDADDEL